MRLSEEQYKEMCHDMDQISNQNRYWYNEYLKEHNKSEELSNKLKSKKFLGSKLTWKELKQKAIKYGYVLVKKVPWEREQECLVNDKGYAFYRDGTVEIECSTDDNLCGRPIFHNRTCREMNIIMEAVKCERG